jgi:hypothetical protein
LEKYPVGLYFSDWFPYKFFLYSSIKIYPIMKEINQVHFTLGDNAGILLMQIAQEALLCELDPEKAVKVITTSLMGCPNNIALKILKGDMVCEVTDDMQNIEVVDYKEEFHKDYPKPNLTDWYERNHKDIGDNGREFYTALEQVIRFVNKRDIEIPIKDIVSLVLSSTMKDWEAFRSKLSHMEDIERIILLVSQCSKFMDRTAKLYRVFDFIDSVYPDVSCNLSRGMHMVIPMLKIRLDAIVTGEYGPIFKQLEDEDEQISEYMKGAENTRKLLSEEIQPVSITDNYNAGWLSRDGTYYGMNGSYANMLHLSLADAIRKRMIVENGVDPLKGFPGKSMDTWLCEQGWVKIHDDHILYDGYISTVYTKKPPLPLSSKQLEAIAKYGKFCHRGMLRFGVTYTPCSMAKLEMMEPPMIAKLLDF